DVLERAGDGGLVVLMKAKAMARCRALEYQGKTRRAVLQIFQRLGICSGRIGVVDALRDDPRTGTTAPGARPVRFPVERRNGDAIGRSRDQAFGEVGSLEDGCNALKPILLRDLRKCVCPFLFA